MMIKNKKCFALMASTVLLLALPVVASATIVGSSFTSAISASGGVQVSPNSGTSFCVGAPLACGSGSGMSSSYSFSIVSPTVDAINFQFFGTTYAETGSFSVALSDFLRPNGTPIYPISSIALHSGSLGGASISDGWDGTTAIMSFLTTSGYDAFGGNYVHFYVTHAVPEPASLGMLGLGLLGIGVMRRKIKARKS